MPILALLPMLCVCEKLEYSKARRLNTSTVNGTLSMLSECIRGTLGIIIGNDRQFSRLRQQSLFSNCQRAFYDQYYINNIQARFMY